MPGAFHFVLLTGRKLHNSIVVIVAITWEFIHENRREKNYDLILSVAARSFDEIKKNEEKIKMNIIVGARERAAIFYVRSWHTFGHKSVSTIRALSECAVCAPIAIHILAIC